MTGHLLTASDVAERLGMTPRWVLAEAREGRLPCYRLGRAVRFDADELASWLNDHHRPALAGLRIADPKASRNPARRAVSRGRVPTMTPPAQLWPAARRSA
jgi:excisionase family DNA binding protein